MRPTCLAPTRVGSPPLPSSHTPAGAPVGAADDTQCDWNAELEVLVMLENGVELLLERSKAWLVYTKAFSSHVEKRTTLGARHTGPHYTSLSFPLLSIFTYRLYILLFAIITVIHHINIDCELSWCNKRRASGAHYE